jgi:hypothetical protein
MAGTAAGHPVELVVATPAVPAIEGAVAGGDSAGAVVIASPQPSAHPGFVDRYNPPPPYVAPVDATGRFRFDWLPPGRYRVRAQRRDESRLRITDSAGTFTAVRDDTTARLALALPR